MKRAYTAEFLATFQLVFIGTGSILLVETLQWPYPNLWIGTAFGLAVFLGIVVFGKTSGAHMNPAVTIALWLKGAFDGKDVPFYVLFQLGGAIVASACVASIYPNHAHYGDTLPKIGNWQSFALEFGLTFLLMLGVLFDVSRKSTLLQAGLLIGTIVAPEACFAGPFSGASMNPARSLGPAVFTGLWVHIWIYVIGTTLGAVTAASIFKKWF